MRNSGVIRYAGKRGVVWRIKYVDATGKQVQETLGREADGWTRKKAAAELRERVVRTEKKGWRKPTALTLGDYADTWFERGQAHRNWSARTVSGYRGVLTRLKEDLGALPLASIRPSRITEYVAWATGVKEQGPASLNRDITLLHDIFKSAKREELIETNPADDVERPKIVQRKWRILEPNEIRTVLKKFEDEQARTVFLTVALTALRRHELQNLRWRDIILTDPERGPYMRVRKSKSESGVRSIRLRPRWLTLSSSIAHGRHTRVKTSWCSARRAGGRLTTRPMRSSSAPRSKRPASRTTFARSTTCVTQASPTTLLRERIPRRSWRRRATRI
jgi:site-specific recombinase XerC